MGGDTFAAMTVLPENGRNVLWSAKKIIFRFALFFTEKPEMCSIVFLHTLGSLGSLHSQRNILGISQNLCKLSLKAGPKLEVNKTEVDKKFVDIESAIHQ